MKNIYLILAFILFVSTVTNAQYRIDKKKYEYRTYNHQVGDPYNTFVAGFTSLLIPGLGQMISGEVGRGAIFFGGATGCTVLFMVELSEAFATHGSFSLELFYLSLGGAFAAHIWAAIDAVRVVKVKNLVFRDKTRTSINLQIRPYIDPCNYNITGKLQPGISLKFRF